MVDENLFRQALPLVEHHWTQNDWYRNNSYCAVGALGEAKFSNPRAAGDGLIGSGLERYVSILAEVIKEKFPDFRAENMDDLDAVVNWNDKKGRAQREVVKVFREAASRWDNLKK